MGSVEAETQERLTRRIDDLQRRLGQFPENWRDDIPARVHELFFGTVTLLKMTYGLESIQGRSVLQSMERVQLSDSSSPSYGDVHWAWSVMTGVLETLRAELFEGLVSTIALRAAGEAIADFLTLAKQALDDEREQAKNVAAVLTAAAFEDAVRRMGASLAGVQGRPDLADVLTALKQEQVIAGPSVTTAQGFLKFRNDALHADWRAIDRAVIGSCLAFTEGLLTTHFA